MTAPGIFFQIGDQTGTYRIPVDVFYKLEEIGVFFNEDRFVPAAKERAFFFVSPIKSLRINTVDMPHTSIQVRLRRLKQKVIVIWHEAICADPNSPEGS